MGGCSVNSSVTVHVHVTNKRNHVVHEDPHVKLMIVNLYSHITGIGGYTKIFLGCNLAFIFKRGEFFTKIVGKFMVVKKENVKEKIHLVVHVIFERRKNTVTKGSYMFHFVNPFC